MSAKSRILEELHNNFEYYCDIIEFSPIAMGAQCRGKVIFMNSAGARLLDADRPYQLVGKTFPELLHEDSRKTVQERFYEIEQNGKGEALFEAKVRRSDGSDIFIEITARPFNYKGMNAVQFTFQDITRRKEMEDMILQSRQDWEETFHTITDMITIHDKDFNIIYANRAAQKILRLPGMDGNRLFKCFKYYHGTEQPPDGCPSCNCLITGKPANFEIYEPHLNIYIEIRSMPRFDRDNNLVGLIHIARDVTARKRTEEEIQKAKDELEQRVEERTKELRLINDQLSEEIGERIAAVDALQKSEIQYRNLSKEFNTLLDGIPDNLLLLDPDLKILWANRAAASAFKIRHSEIRSQYCYSLCCNILSPCGTCPTIRSFQSGREETSEITTTQGKMLDIRAFPIRDENGNIINVIELARDITERATLQADATRTRHLASLGELAAGVAHEINNPINNILNYAQILIDEFDEEGKNDDVARRIMRDSDRIAAIVRSLLSFARIRKEEKSLICLHEIFSDTLSLINAQIKKDAIHFKINMPPEPVRISAHTQQIQQVFLNIISNSRYALNEKYPEPHENKILEIQCEKIMVHENPYARIVFRDHGAGIPEDIIDKVVNPFFSTKPNRMGTGLGLSISHGIITEHKGTFSIRSAAGEYTEITLELPEA